MLEQMREVKGNLVFSTKFRNPDAGKVGWLERLRKVRREREHERETRRRSKLRSPRKRERSREVRFRNLWKMREGDDDGSEIVREYMRSLVTERRFLETRDRVPK